MYVCKRQGMFLGTLAITAVVCSAGPIERAAKAAFVAEQGSAKGAATNKKAPHGARSDLELAKALREVVDFKGLDDPKTTLEEALRTLEKDFHVSIEIDEKVFSSEVLKGAVAPQTPIPPMRAPLRQVLRKILSRLPESSSATWLIRKDGYIEITTLDAARVELGIAPDRPLLPLVYDEFEEERLSTALQKLSDASGWSVVLDVAAVDDSGMNLSARLYNVPLDSAVRTLATLAGLAVVRIDNVLLVTNRQKAAILQAEASDGKVCAGGAAASLDEKRGKPTRPAR
jgi:hypothetical protein